MTPAAAAVSPARWGIPRFFRTPKGLLIVILSVLAVLAMPQEGLAPSSVGLASAVLAAAGLDLVATGARRRAWELPSGAIITGLIIAMVLSPQEPWYVVACTSAVAIGSKALIRIRGANVFNPAALSIVVTFYVFDTGQSWWGALPGLPPAAIALVIAAGWYIADRVNRMPMVLAFLTGYFVLFTAAAFLGDPRRVAEIFRAPDLHAALFFALFILTDPPTSPVKYRHQIACGAIVAASGFAVFELVGAAHYLLAGVLAGNLWDAWRRARLRRPGLTPAARGPY